MLWAIVNSQDRNDPPPVSRKRAQRTLEDPAGSVLRRRPLAKPPVTEAVDEIDVAEIERGEGGGILLSRSHERFITRRVAR